MEKLKIILDIASITLSIITIIYILVTWKTIPEPIEIEEA